MNPADERRMIHIAPVQIFRVEDVMGLVYTQAECGGNKEADKGKGTDDEEYLFMLPDHAARCPLTV